jgi:hyperosmotically inducible periplasmic protein
MKSRMKGGIAFVLFMVMMGCSVVLVGCPRENDRRTVGVYVDDTVITTRVRAAFAADPDVSAMDIGVQTVDGVVQLTGFADTEEQARIAEEVAEDVEGVRAVRNDIVVQ